MSIATEALKRAVEEMKQETMTTAKAPKPVADVAIQHGWTPGQRDMALKMWVDKKSLTEIRAEIQKPAEEIVEVLGLDKADRLSNTPPALACRIMRLAEKGYSQALIAMILNADGFKTGRGNEWTKNTIAGMVHRARRAGLKCE